MDILTNSLRPVIASWLNASQASRDGVGMNRSAGGRSLKHFEQSQGLDTALYKNVPLLALALRLYYTLINIMCLFIIIIIINIILLGYCQTQSHKPGNEFLPIGWTLLREIRGDLDPEVFDDPGGCSCRPSLIKVTSTIFGLRPWFFPMSMSSVTPVFCNRKYVLIRPLPRMSISPRV